MEDINKQLIEEFTEALEANDRKSLEMVKRKATTVVNTGNKMKSIREGTHNPKQYMRGEEVDTAYKHALDADNPTVDDCFDRVVVEHGVTIEYIEEVKNRPTLDVRKVIDNNILHPKVQEMVINDIFQVKSLKKSSTPNQLLTGITKRRKVNDRLEALEATVSKLQADMRDSQLRHMSSELAIEGIQGVLSKLTTNTKKQNALLLRDKGYKQSEIAKVLSVDVRTVKRYLN